MLMSYSDKETAAEWSENLNIWQAEETHCQFINATLGL